MVTIYKLYCIHTGEAYIGCTAGKLGKRMREHRCLLNKGRHSATRMQQLWDEHGSAGFRLESVETLPKDATVIDKRKREVFWMEHFEKDGLLLNHTKASFTLPESARTKESRATAIKTREANGNRHITPEGNQKRRLAQLGKPKNHGHKISAAKKGVPMKKEECPNCGRLIGISNLPRHIASCEKVEMI